MTMPPACSDPRFEGLYKACTEAIEHLNVLQHEFDLLSSRVNRLEADMLEAVTDLHWKLDSIISARATDDDPGHCPQETDLCLESMD